VQQTAILIVGHGSRNQKSNQEFRDLVDRFALSRNELVQCAFIELAEPGLTEALDAAAKKARQILVIPLALFGAGHVKNDIPLAIAEAQLQHPDTIFKAAGPMGLLPELVKLAAKRGREVLDRDQSRRKRTEDHMAVLVIGRGSSDPDANSDFYKVARMIGEALGDPFLVPCFVGVTGPDLESSLELAVKTRPKRIVVIPYFLLQGILISRIHDQVAEFGKAWPHISMSVASYLGVDSLMCDALSFQAEGLVGGKLALPCVSCKYRVPTENVVKNFSALKALLWSQRHRFTHSQAVDHVHSHKPIKKHIFVCTNIDCAEKGGFRTLQSIRRKIKDAGLQNEVAVTRTSCMGKCGEGPAVVVYPDGIWYRELTSEFAGPLITEHIQNDRLFSERVDHIMN